MNNLRHITPAIAVMVAGLAGAYLVYDNFFTQNSTDSIAAISPAAGEYNEESIIIAEADAAEGAVAATTEAVTETVTEGAAAVTTTETTVTETTTTEVAPAPVPAPDCTTLEAAATAAMGTVDAEKTQKAVTECHAAKEAAAKAQAAADAAKTAPVTEGAVDAAKEAAPAAVEGAVDAAKEAAPAATDAAVDAAKEAVPAVGAVFRGLRGEGGCQ